MKYQLAAFDMDGTLLTSDKRILPETLEAIREADKAGKYIALCTGRPLCELAPYKEYLQYIRFAILESGGILYDFKESRVIRRHCLPAEAIPEILKIITLEDIMPQAMIGGKSYIRTCDLDRMDHYFMGVYHSLYAEVAICTDGWKDLVLSKAREIDKINLYHVDRATSIRTHDRLEGLSIERTYAETSSLELSPSGVNKGTALLDLTEYLHIPVEETMAVGDADNDIPSIKAAGLGVAMANANANVREIADVITRDNDHDGCGEVIRKYML